MLDNSFDSGYNDRVANEYSSIAQSVERMTVNHDVVGSSPTGGAKQKSKSHDLLFCLAIGFNNHSKSLCFAD